VTVLLPHIFDKSFTEIAAAFERANPGVTVKRSTGLLDEVVRDVTSGKEQPDVFLSIGEIELRPIRDAGMVLEGSGQVFARSTLVVLAPKGNPKGLTSLSDLTSDKVESIAVPSSDANSAGAAFTEALKNAGIWVKVQSKISPRPIPKDATALVEELTETDLAVTYSPCYLFGHADTCSAVSFVDPGLHSPIEGTAVMLKGSENPDLGRALIAFLTTDEAQDIWEKWGFTRVRPKSSKQASQSLLVYCGAGLRDAMDPIAEAYREETGVRVYFSYAGAGVLLTQIAFSKTGDLYMPGERFYLRQAEERGLILDTETVCYFKPVIAVQKGNPQAIQCIDDLAKPGLRVGLGDPKALAVGPVTQHILTRAGIADRVDKNVTFRGGCIPELANALRLQTIDASILWSTTAYQNREHVDMIEIPAQLNEVAVVPIGVLKHTGDPDAARRFMDFVVSPAAREIFRRHGYITDRPAGIPVAES